VYGGGDDGVRKAVKEKMQDGMSGISDHEGEAAGGFRTWK